MQKSNISRVNLDLFIRNFRLPLETIEKGKTERIIIRDRHLSIETDFKKNIWLQGWIVTKYYHHWQKQDFKYVKKAIDFLLDHEFSLEISRGRNLYVRLRIGQDATIKNAQYSLGFNNYKNLNPRDYDLALEVILGKIGIEFYDYLQDHYNETF